MNIMEKLREIDEKGEEIPRKPVAALLLSFCPGFGQQYSGNLKRGIILYMSLIIVSWLTAIIFMFLEGRAAIALFVIPVAGFFAIAFDAYRLAAKAPANYRLKWYNRGWLYGCVFILLVLIVNPLMDIIFGGSVTRAALSTSVAMEPTILKHDVLLVDKLSYQLGEPQKGDIVYIIPGEEKVSFSRVNDSQIIYRIIAGPGDTIEVKQKQVYVNNKLLDESYVRYESNPIPTSMSLEDNSFESKVVPDGSYFVLGDNRSYSIDSRVFGFIGRDKIAGKIKKVYWSWNFEGGNKKTIKWDRVGLVIR